MPFGKLQNFNNVQPPHNNNLLSLSLMVTLSYSVPIIFLLLDDTLNKICQGKGTFVREVSGDFNENPSSRYGPPGNLLWPTNNFSELAQVVGMSFLGFACSLQR